MGGEIVIKRRKRKLYLMIDGLLFLGPALLVIRVASITRINTL
jgi:hypothetical protein